MAEQKDVQRRRIRKSFKTVVDSINTVHTMRHKSTGINLGIETDIPEVMNRKAFSFADTVLNKSESLGNAINGELSVVKSKRSKASKVEKDLYDIISDKEYHGKS